MERIRAFGFSLQLPEESVEFAFIQLAAAAHAAAHVKAKGADLLHRRADVFRAQSARQKRGDIQLLANARADGPIMRAARAAEFLDRQRLITRIKQDRINLGGDP